MNIFITGGTGCLGARIIKDLMSAGHTIKALVRKCSNQDAITPSLKLELVYGDLTDPESLSLGAKNCKVAIHAAASLHFVPTTSDEIKKQYQINVDGTKNVIEACETNGVEHFIHMGSIASMGDFYNEERDETYPCTPESYYGKSKYESEKLALSFNNAKMKVTVLRPGVVYGAWDRGTILKLIKYIHTGKFHFIGNGNNHKSIVSVGNVSAATRSVMLNPSAFGEIFIIVDKEKLTIKEIAQTIASKLNVPISPFHIPLWFAYIAGYGSDILRNISPFSLPLSLQNVRNFTHSATYSIKKIHKKIGFIPPETFHEAIENEINWYLADSTRKL